MTKLNSSFFSPHGNPTFRFNHKDILSHFFHGKSKGKYEDVRNN